MEHSLQKTSKKDYKLPQERNSYITVKDHLVSGEQFDLLYDPKLDMLITHPQPSASELSKYYESESYISHTDNEKGLIPFLYQKVKRFAIQRKVRLITSFHGASGSVLDIGAGTGDFLQAAKEKGWNVHGVEINATAREKARDKNIELLDDLDAIQNQQFDVITLWHVLEHLPNLEETIAALNRLLKKDGVLVIAVPNFKSYDAKYYKSFWAAYDAPRHLWHFSRVSIQKLFVKNFKLLKIKPMWFDSFYVSLLSEQYKNKKSFSIQGVFVGLWSNCKGLFTKDYSSLIYCFKKD